MAESMTDEIKAEYGRCGYESYAAFTGGKTFDGRPMPPWQELPQHIRDAWSEAADKILDRFVDRNF